MISHKVEKALVMAIREAKIRKHEHVTVEHILFGLLHDDMVVEIIDNCGCNIEKLKSSLETFFNRNLPLLEEIGQEPSQTIGFNRVLQRAIAHVQSCGKKEVDSGDVLTAIFSEPESFAVYFLQSEGLSRLELIEYISHRMESKPATRPKTEESQKEPAKTALEKDYYKS